MVIADIHILWSLHFANSFFCFVSAME